MFYHIFGESYEGRTYFNKYLNITSLTKGRESLKQNIFGKFCMNFKLNFDNIFTEFLSHK